MKIFDMDCSYKAITFEVEEKRYEINFKNSLMKGIHDIKVSEFPREKNNKKIQIYSINKGLFSDMRILIKYIWNSLKVKMYVMLENNLFPNM